MRKMQETSYIQSISQQRITVEGITYSSDELDKLYTFAENYIDNAAYKDVVHFLQEWFNEKEYINVQTSGSTGIPKQLRVRKEQMINSAVMTCSFLNMQKGENVLLCMSLQYIGAKMIVVRALVAGLNLIVREASGHPLQHLSRHIHLAAMVPLQIYNTLQEPEEKEKLKSIDKVLIGGGNINPVIEKELQVFPNAIYSTYGMTETVSHIALRKLTNPDASSHYTPFPQIELKITEEGCLEITAPTLSDEKISTNDLAELYPDGTFRILGRKDNIINTGGIKVSIEKLEEMLSLYIPYPFAITSLPDNKFGEVITLLIATDSLTLSSIHLPDDIPSVYRPKHIFTIKDIPLTPTNKVNRIECRNIAKEYLENKMHSKE